MMGDFKDLLAWHQKAAIEFGQQMSDENHAELIRARLAVLASHDQKAPATATPAMLEAYNKVLGMGSELDGSMVWRAMLEAAPK